MISSTKRASFDLKGIFAMLFFMVPFFRPSIVNDWSVLAPLKAIFTLWLLAACVVAIGRFVLRNGRIGLFLVGLVSMLLVMFFSTWGHGGLLYDALVDIAMFLGMAAFVGTLERQEVKPFLQALIILLFSLVAAELIMRFLIPQGIYRYEGFKRWILESGSMQSRWCFILVFASAVFDYMRKRKYGILFYCSVAISLIMVLQLQSAVSIVGLAVELAILAISGSLTAQRVFTCFRVSVVLMVAMVAVVFFRIADYLPYDAIATFLGNDLTYQSGATFTGRTYIWDSVMASIAQSPLFGNGFQQFVATDVYQILSQTDFSSSHNLWLQVAYQGGFVGLFFFFLSYCSACSQADSVGPGRARLIFVALLAAFVLASVFENTLNAAFVLVMAIPVSNVVLQTVEGLPLSEGDVDGEL